MNPNIVNNDEAQSNDFLQMASEVPSFEEHIQELEAHKDTIETAERSFTDIISDINSIDIDVITSLNTTNPNAKDEFMTNPDLDIPNNTHDKLDADIVHTNLEKISQIEAEVEQNNTLSSKEKSTVLIALNAAKLKNTFLLANIRYNESPTEENEAFYREANEALYGKPDDIVFRSLLFEKLDKIEGRELSPEEQQEFEELKQLLGPIERPSQERHKPSQDIIDAFSETVHLYMGPIFEHVPEGKDSFTPEETANIMRSMLDDIIDDGSDWTVEVNPNGTAINVNQNTKTISVAGKRANGDLDSMGLKKILAHEVGTHFMRAEPFENFSVQMFRTGMPGYEEFEEGVAKVMEQGVSGKYEDSGINHYLSIGMANILGKNFRETYEIQRRLAHLSEGKNKDSVLFNSVQRAFRGTDRLPNNKDLVYYNGADKVWKYIESHIDDPELFDNLFLSGKTDITDLDQAQLAYEAKVGGLI